VTAIGRAFVAVVPPAEVLDALEARLAPARRESALRWMRRNQLHFTLQFLGRVGDEELLATALQRGIGPHASFEARLAGAGAFPSARRARVVWIGVDTGADPFGALARTIHQTTEQLGYEIESREYTPHMTVARSTRPSSVQHEIGGIGSESIEPAWDVSEVLLFASDTRPDGAVHTVRRRFELLGR
jgi:RNA 2',3'-cyclic 3'-phosphodiesterase